ncbi:MAG: hypothetical protein A2X22_05840 [Bacteroidetes bacterium GWF2_49_14]|nr:MAG: hypothetical protein A2X22_05840 [Bacteroidetes bacterium GWF2_49_14]
MTLEELSELTTRKRVLVTGGAGSVGLEVLRELYQHKTWYEVTVLDKNSPDILRKLKPYRNEFRIITGNIFDREVVDRATANIDFVIHLAAVIPPLADLKPDLAEKVNIGGTKVLVRSLEKNSPDAFLLFTSSISVYGDRVYNPWITAEDPLLPSEGDYYAETKIRAEKMIRQSRLNWAVFRLSAIMSPDARLDPLFFHMPLDTSLEIATSRDTGFALVEAIYHQDSIRGQVFNLSGGGGCRTTYREFLSNAFRIKGLKKLDFPEAAFAERNFHCGFYTDSDKLESILHFQRDSLETFYGMLESKGSNSTKKLYSLFHTLIKKYLLRKSEPMRALQNGHKPAIHRFYYSQVP